MEPALAQLLADLGAFLRARGVAAWLVGGAARDLAMGRSPVDLDVAVAGDGHALARAYADATGAAFVALDAGRGTGRVVVRSAPPLTLDLAALRAPTLEADLRLRDFTVNALAINLPGDGEGLGTPLDPTGGLADLRAGVLRACGPRSMADDPLRVLRAARLCATLGLRPEPGLAALLRAAAPGLAGVAGERSRDELLKLLDAPGAGPWLRYLDDCGALTALIPELEPARACTQPNVHFLPVLAHILETVTALDWLILSVKRKAQSVEQQDAISPQALPAQPVWSGTKAPYAVLPVAVQTHPELRSALPFAERLAPLLAERRAGGHSRAALLKLGALLHDVAKPQTKEVHPDGKVSFYEHQTIGAGVAARICKRLRLSRHDTAQVALIVREHMRPGQLRTSEVVTMRAVNRFFRDLGDAGPDVLLHELADHLATRGPAVDVEGWDQHLAWVEALLEVYYVPRPAPRPPLVDGNALMAALDLAPGPLVGALLREIEEAREAGEISTGDEALALARARLTRPG